MFSLFTKKNSVDAVMKSFTQTILDLQDVAANNTLTANNKLDEANRLNDEAHAHLTESERASNIAEKLNQILS